MLTATSNRTFIFILISRLTIGLCSKGGETVDLATYLYDPYYTVFCSTTMSELIIVFLLQSYNYNISFLVSD